MQKLLFVGVLVIALATLFAGSGTGFDNAHHLAFVLSAVMLPSANVRPLVHSVPDVMALLSCSRSLVYELIGKGELDAVKVLSATRITDQSVQRLLAGAPKGLGAPAVPERKRVGRSRAVA